MQGTFYKAFITIKRVEIHKAFQFYHIFKPRRTHVEGVKVGVARMFVNISMHFLC